jgi:hypothetical protein
MSVLGLLAAIALGAAAEERGPGRWLDLKTPGGNVAMDSGGQLWVVTQDGLRCWDGKKLVAPKVNEAEGKASLADVRLYGNRGVGAYALMHGKEPDEGLAYRLSAGEVRLATHFYQAPEGAGRFGFLVSRTGVMVNWGQHFLATRRDGEWKRTEAQLNYAPCIFSTPHYVVLATNGWIYTVDSEGRITELAAPALGPSVGEYDTLVRAEPGPEDAVKFTNTGLGAACMFHPDTGQLIALPRPHYMDSPYAHQRLPPSAPFLCCAADGSVKCVGAQSQSLVPRVADQPGWNERVCLAASDGSFWTALSDGSVAHYADDKLTVYDWHDGVLVPEAKDVLEGTGGQVFVCSWQTICAFLPDQQPAPPPAWAVLWDRFFLDPYSSAVQDSLGRIWVQKADSASEFSVWDGARWTQVKPPVDPRSNCPTLTDDRGRVIIAQMRYDVNGPSYVVGLDGTKLYDSIHAMLQALLAEGVRSFRPVGTEPPCYVLDGGRICYGLDYFDGARWTRISPNSGEHVFQSPRHGVLFFTYQGNQFAYYDGAQLLPLAIPMDRPSYWLLGDAGLQPFEPELVAARPGAFLPVVRLAQDNFLLLQTMPVSSDADLPLSSLGDPSGRYGSSALAGLAPVFYLRDGDVVRAWAVQGRSFKFSLAGTPMEGREGYGSRVMVDPARNLWLVWNGDAYVKHTRALRIAAAQAVERVGKELALDVRVEEPGLEAGQGYVFWRLNAGDWQGGVAPGKVGIPLAADRDCTVELIGVDPQGCVTAQPLELAVRAGVVQIQSQAAEDVSVQPSGER